MCLVIILSLPWDTKTALLQSSEKDKINRREEEEKALTTWQRYPKQDPLFVSQLKT
jgi:hypothetical protein